MMSPAAVGVSGAAKVAAAPFIMSWNIQYLGTYSCRKITSQSLRRRINKVLQTEIPPQFVYLSVSLDGVFVASEDSPQTPFLSHSIRRVCCVVGKAETRQVAYVTRKPLDDGSSKKECHIFRTEIPHQVEQVESVLSSAFQRMVFVDNASAPYLDTQGAAIDSCTPSETTITTESSGSQRTASLTSRRYSEASSRRLSVQLDHLQPVTSTPKSAKRQMSAAGFLQKVFGTPKTSTPLDASDTPVLRSANGERRRKRPVSAVFGQAIHKLTSGALSSTPKKTPSRTSQISTPAAMYRDKMALTNIEEHTADSHSVVEDPEDKEPALEFDEKLGEFVFPIGRFMDDQLQRLAYFCRNPNRKEVYAVLADRPEGAFILRYSESRQRCLALSVRVPSDAGSPVHQRVGHFLIVRNEQGFRFHGSEQYFSSLPMLITHHTVLPELLPCRLIFVEWDKALLRDLPQTPRPTTSAPIHLDDVHVRARTPLNCNVPPRCRPLGVDLAPSPYRKVARCD